MSPSIKEHWNKVYSSSPSEELGWYEVKPTLSLELIERCSIDKNDSILDVGAGSTTLIDHLINQNYQRITALDISEVALLKLQKRLGTAQASQIQWVIDDITKPTSVWGLKDIAVWHDRALLHFLTTEKQRQIYLSVLKKVVRKGGYAIIATFAKDGVSKCSGLDVKRYDQQSLTAFLGEKFELKEIVHFNYQMPSGSIRPYIYGRFQKLG